MREIASLILIFASLTGLCQSVESICEKITYKICDCINDNVNTYADIKSEFNRCYDLEFNNIFNIVDSDEQKVLLKQDALAKIKNCIIPTLNDKCEKIRRIINSEIDNSIQTAVHTNTKSFPVNFEENDFKEIEKWKNKIVALEGEVVKVAKSRQNTAYSKLKMGDEEIWVISMMDSGVEKVGNRLRILGYLLEIDSNDCDYERKIHNDKYHVLSFGIVNLENMQCSSFPGSEMQIKQWINGKIPNAK